MLPLGLKVLLGKAENPPVSKMSRPKSQPTISDWLKFNGLTREAVLRQLALVERVDAPDNSELQIHLGLTADEAWALCAAAMRAVFPGLKPEIDQIEAGAPKCLQPKSIKHPEPFTYDLGFQKLPFVSLHYLDRPDDLLAMAHEFGHAVQIAASWQSGDEQMPPVARETCAFLGELAVILYSQNRFSCLPFAHRKADVNYFGDKTQELKTAIQGSLTPYRYGWNYPIARIVVRRIRLAPGQAAFLFKAGRNGGQVLAELISGSLEKEVAA